MNWEIIGQNLKTIREERGLSLQDVELDLNEMGYSLNRTTLSRYENGKSKSGQSLEKLYILAKYYQVPLEYILGISDQKQTTCGESWKELGISEEAAKVLKQKRNDQAFLDILNFLIEEEGKDDHSTPLFKWIKEYFCYKIFINPQRGYYKHGVFYYRDYMARNDILGNKKIEQMTLGGYLENIRNSLVDLRETFQATGKDQVIKTYLTPPTAYEKHCLKEHFRPGFRFIINDQK